MGEIPGLVARTMVRFATRRGYTVERLARDLPSDFGRMGKRVDWDDLTLFLDRMHACDPDAMRAYAEHYLRDVPIISHLGSQVVSLSALYRVCVFGWRRAWSILDIHSAPAQHGLTLAMTVPDTHRPSAAFFELAGEVLERLPRLIQEPDVEVEVTHASTRSISWRVSLPSRALSEDDPEPEEIFASLQTDLFGAAPVPIPAEWKLSPGETRVVLALAKGRSVNEIAKESGSSRETVRTLLKRAMAKAGVHRQTQLLARLHARD